MLFQVLQQAAELASLYCGFVSQDQASMRIISFVLNGSLSEPQHLCDIKAHDSSVGSAQTGQWV